MVITNLFSKATLESMDAYEEHHDYPLGCILDTYRAEIDQDSRPFPTQSSTTYLHLPKRMYCFGTITNQNEDSQILP